MSGVKLQSSLHISQECENLPAHKAGKGWDAKKTMHYVEEIIVICLNYSPVVLAGISCSVWSQLQASPCISRRVMKNGSGAGF